MPFAATRDRAAVTSLSRRSVEAAPEASQALHVAPPAAQPVSPALMAAASPAAEVAEGPWQPHEKGGRSDVSGSTDELAPGRNASAPQAKEGSLALSELETRLAEEDRRIDELVGSIGDAGVATVVASDATATA